MRAFLIVLDSVGIGAAPDAAAYGDEGANTLGHLAATVGGVRWPTFERLGLGNIPGLLPAGVPIQGVPPARAPEASYGAMQEVSVGKDTTTGHWEMAGLELRRGFHVFPPGPPAFPGDLLTEFERRTGRGTLGNKAASGTAIIEELGREHMRSGAWIVYTSADSVFQIAAHEAAIPLEELYRGCTIARELCNPLQVGRVIARPFVGSPGAFRRTQNRRDYSMPLPGPTILDRQQAAGIPTLTVGKLDDIFNRQGIDRAIHVENSADAIRAVLDLAADLPDGFVFANLIDFDMLYGHRRDPVGYARAMDQADAFIAALLPRLRPEDVLLISADHGNDPTFRGTDHCREFVPLLVVGPGRVPGRSLGIRQGFFDVAQSLATLFNVPPMERGVSFLES
jgi:phosphopentomutase